MTCKTTVGVSRSKQQSLENTVYSQKKKTEFYNFSLA